MSKFVTDRRLGLTLKQGRFHFPYFVTPLTALVATPESELECFVIFFEVEEISPSPKTIIEIRVQATHENIPDGFVWLATCIEKRNQFHLYFKSETQDAEPKTN